MKNFKFLKYFTIIALALFLFNEIIPEDLYARGSFGGSRGGGGRSFGGSKSFGSSRSSSKSFGGSRSSNSYNTSRPSSSTPSRSTSSYEAPSKMPRSSFGGGTRMSSNYEARAKYGTPRKVDNYAFRDNQGISRNYQINDYGGYSSALMRGYMMGQVSSWMFYAPWHGAFWYSRPVYVENPDGSVAVYPPTFSTGKLIFTIIIVGGIIFIVYVIIRARRRRNSYESQSSFD